MPGKFDFNRSYANAPSRQNTVWDYMASTDPTIENRFDDYKNMFGFDKMKGSLDDIFGGYEDKIERNVFEDIGRSQKGAGERFASRGITGGSVLDDTHSGIAADINKTKYNALSDLGIGKASSMKDLMEIFNQRKLLTTKMGSDVARDNVLGKMKKGNQLANYDAMWRRGDLEEDQQAGWLEDMMSGGGDIMEIFAMLAPLLAAPVTGGTSLAMGPAMPFSDRRIKENIEFVGIENGFNLYDFNYIGFPGKRFRFVMAQEVEKIMPGAVSSIAGIKYVDGNMIGIQIKEV